MTINQETAQLLKKVAAVFRIKEGDTFRYKAYINASVAIDNLSEPITEIWKRGELANIPGIGEKLSQHLAEYLTKGRSRHFDSILKKVPAGVFSLMTIRGVGSITAGKIAKKFHLNDQETALGRLKEILLTDDLTKITGFKEKTIIKIQKALKIRSFGKDRMLLSDVLPIADSLIDYLKRSKDILTAEPLGSLRRKLATIGDIDIAFCTTNPKKAMAYALEYPDISTIITRGDQVGHVRLKSGFEVDLKISEPKSWGSMLQHYTGGKLHNIKLRSLAKAKNLSLSEYGILQKKKVHHFISESKFYQFLGMEYIPPEIRENEGEIELAQKHKIPKLIELKEIKGDLHIHSDSGFISSHDHGLSPLAELLKKAEELNYEYIGISDHNPKFNDSSEIQKKKIIIDYKKSLETQYRAYENSVKHRVPKLLIGMEVDIRVNGELALSDENLDLLDYAIVSIHSSFDMDSPTNTQRIIKGLSHPKAKIFGHPTGRVLNGRQPIAANWNEIFEYCAKNKKIIEINAYPTRLDLPDDLIRNAVGKGVKMIINTDSHEVSQIDHMKYGVWQARRGYAEKSDITNTFSFKDLHQVLEL